MWINFCGFLRKIVLNYCFITQISKSLQSRNYHFFLFDYFDKPPQKFYFCITTFKSNS